MRFAAPVRHRCHDASHLAREDRDCVDAGHHQPRGGVTRHPGGGRVIPLFLREGTPTPPVFVFSILSRLHLRNFLKIPDPEVGEAHWANGSGYLRPPRQLDLGQQMARAMMAGTYPLDSFADCLDWEAKIEERHRRMLEDNRKQIAEAEQRQREEREAAEARKAQEAERAARPSRRGPRPCSSWTTLDA